MEDIAESRKSYVRNLSTLDKEREKRIGAIQAEYRQERRGLELGFYGKICSDLVSGLNSDYKTLQDRSTLCELSRDDLSTVIKMFDLGEKVKDNPDRYEGFLETIRVLNPEIESGVVTMMDLRKRQKPEITSYISSDDKVSCYLVCPIDGKSNKKLAKNLEAKISGILELGEVVTGSVVQVDSRDTLSKVNQKKIRFKYSQILSNGFLVYSLTLENSGNSELLRDELSSKLQGLQPEGFSTIGLSHKASVIDHDILDYFKSKFEHVYNPSTQLDHLKNDSVTRITYEEAAKMLGRKVKGLKILRSKGFFKGDKTHVDLASLQKYAELRVRPGKNICSVLEQKTGGEPNNQHEILKESALRKLEAYKSSGTTAITMHDLANVLGVTVTNVYHAWKDKVRTGQDAQGRMNVDVDSVLQALQNHRHTGRGWMAIK